MSAWQGLIAGAHALIALRRNEPHWLLNDADARTYGTALANAARHLPIGATQKAVDFAALFICAAHIETPRVYASMRNRQARRQGASSPRPATATVYPFPSAASPPSAPPSTAGPSAPSSDMQPVGDGVEGFQADGIDGPIGGNA